MVMHVSSDRFRDAMRRFAANVSLITAEGENASSGLTATAVCSLSADPPSLLVCVNRNASALAAIERSEAFAVNVLAGEHCDHAKLFSSSRPDDRQRRFSQGVWSRLHTGSPILADAVVAFDCKLVRQICHATHAILIGQVMDIHVGGTTGNLLYVQGGFTTLDRAIPAS